MNFEVKMFRHEFSGKFYLPKVFIINNKSNLIVCVLSYY